jgi:hypothetical protein
MIKLAMPDYHLFDDWLMYILQQERHVVIGALLECHVAVYSQCQAQ